MTEAFGFIESIGEKIGVWSYIMKKNNEKEKQKTNELIKNLKIAQNELEVAVNNYEYAKEPELVDYYTYNIKAAQARYEYLLKIIKAENIKLIDERRDEHVFNFSICMWFNCFIHNS